MDQPFELRRHGAVVKVSTKVGQLSVTDDCNIQYGVDQHGDGVVVGLDFDHRSEDISAQSRIKLTPDQARDMAEWLKNAASEIERGTGRL